MAEIVDQKKFDKAGQHPLIQIETDQMRHDKRMVLNKEIRKQLKETDPDMAARVNRMSKGQRQRFYRVVREKTLKKVQNAETETKERFQ
jgi:hypothetical protein